MADIQQQSQSAVMAHKRSSSGSSRSLSATIAAHASTSTSQQQMFDQRPSFLDESALSAAEFAVYPQWLMTIKPSRSGEADHIDEQDALRFIREECGIEVHDEIKILSLFERFPLGLLPGHFYALLRLASWVQRGETPTKTLMFTQTAPPRIGLGSNEPVQPPPQHIATTNGIASTAMGRSHQRDSLPTAQRAPPVAASLSSSPKNSRSVPPLPAQPTSSASAQAHTPLIPVSSMDLTNKPAPPPPVPDDSHKPGNPFRHASGSAAPVATHAVSTSAGGPSSHHNGRSAILGFQPSPNPFKQSKPKLVKPTPIVADASMPVVIRPTSGGISNAAVDPFKSGQSASSRANSPISSRSLVNASPPTIPGEVKPPPLPPRHISPLIQAGLNARSQVRRAQGSLPPKTFTVLQSTQSRHPLEGPRLLTGQAAPPPPPPQATKRRSIGEKDTRISSSSVAGGTTATSAKGTDHVPDRRAGPLPTPIAPKPSYGSHQKAGVPAWLREQEELQRSSSHDHHNEPNLPPRESHSRSTNAATATSMKRHKIRTTSAAARIQFLDNDSDSESSDGPDDGTLSEQARSAASIDRNNPFFQHGRDLARSVDLKESLNKLAVENAVTKAERDSRLGARASSDSSTTKADGMDKRPLGRSKTLRDGTRIVVPPAVPPRKRNEAFPATFNSGTYPGFGRSVRVEGPTMGGLRQTPISRKAEVGIPAHVLAERERTEREKQERAASAPLQDEDAALQPPPPPPRQRRPSSSTQISVSDGGTPLSPRDEMPPPQYTATFDKDHQAHGGLTDTLKQEFDSLSERHAWLARIADRAKGRTKSNEAQIGLMEEFAQERDQSDDDEAEVDEHYLAEKRREQQLQQRQWQRGSTIDVIREEEPTPGARRNAPGQGHPSLSQRRATDSIRRSLSGAGGMSNLVRRSSLLARGSFGAEDVIASDDTDEENQATPKRERSAMFDNDSLAAETKAPDVDALDANGFGEHQRREAGWQPLS